jgi:hypothetical protein
MRSGIAASLAIAGLLAAVTPAHAADKKKEDSSKTTKESDTFTQGKKGEAKEALERSAGKKAEDVKVPAPSPPTPVKTP